MQDSVKYLYQKRLNETLKKKLKWFEDMYMKIY